MNGELSLSLAFATGVLGALHCLGMCSGIAGGFFVRYGQGARIAPVLTFHGARILVYTTLGVAGAAAGRVLTQAGILGKGQGVLMMVAGVLIVLIGLDLLRRMPGPMPAVAEVTPLGVPVRFEERPRNSPGWLPVLGGALNGIVPCGLVFSVAVKAAASADPFRAGMLMAAFGLGTLPAMGAVSLMGSVIGTRARRWMVPLAGILVVALGLWTLYEGAVFFDVMRGLGNW